MGRRILITGRSSEMSETQRTLFNKRVSGLWIAGAFLLLAIVCVVSVPSRPIPEFAPVKETPSSPPHIPKVNTKISETSASALESVHFQSSTLPTSQSDFYRMIIDNNLFRPLGWTPPQPREPYRLIGTILPRSANTPPKAIIQTTAGNQTYIVSIGETLDASTEVVLIEGKQVTLSRNGQQRTLRLNTAIYLNPSLARRSPIRTTHTLTPMRRPPTVSAPQTDRPLSPSPRRPLSDWETREGERIRFGDARLKNPQKWGLRRR